MRVLLVALISGMGMLLHAQNVPSFNTAQFQVMGARALGPSTMSGRITSIEGAYADAQLNLYVGTAGGGIWKSQNGGQSFTPIFDKYNQSIGALALEPGSAKVVYAGTGESNMRNSVSIGAGLYKTTDGGSNWQKLGLDSTEHISKIAIDPTDKKVVYVAAPGPLFKSSTHRGLYKSTDAGKTWEKILYINENTGCADIAVHPTNPKIVFASTWEFRRKAFSFVSGGSGSAFYKSVDGGKTWNKLTKGLPEGNLGRIVVTINPSKPSQVLALVEAKESALYQSNDEGETWTKLTSASGLTARPFYFSTLVIDPKDPKRVYRPAYDFNYSNDGGSTFANTVIGGVAPHADHHALWINPSNTDMLFLGTDGGVYLSYNKGVTWQFLNNLPVPQFYHVSIDNQSPYNIYGGLQDNNNWMAPNTAPGGVAATDWKALGGGDGFWVQPDALDDKIVYAESQGGEMYRINLRTGLSAGIKPKKQTGEDDHRWNWNTPIVTAKSNTKSATGKLQSNLYVGAQYLFRSRDNGKNWERISPDLTTNNKAIQNKSENSESVTGDNTSAENHGTIFTLVQHPTNENIIWVGTDDGNLMFTNNGGKTWQNKNSGITKAGVPAQAWISSIELSANNSNRIFVTLDHHMYGDNNTYAVVSNDGGNSFTKFESEEFSGFAHIIREDPKAPDLLFLGTESGFFISLNAGKSWMRSKYQNLPWYSLVRDIKIHPTTNDLIIATHGRGVYIIDDIQPLREMVKSDLSKSFLFYPVQPFKYEYGAQYPQAPSNLVGYAGASKSLAPTFYYYLKERSNDVVKIEIFNAANQKIKDLNGTGLKGLNKVFWTLTSNPPRVAKGGFVAQSSIQYAGFYGPKVPAGKYRIVVKAGKDSSSQILTVLPNPAAGLSEIALQKLHQQSMRVFLLQEQLADMVDTIDVKLAAWNKMPSSDMITQKVKAMDAFKRELIELNRKSIFFDETKFRKRISDFYLDLVTALEPLSEGQEKGINVLETEMKEFKTRLKQLL